MGEGRKIFCIIYLKSRDWNNQPYNNGFKVFQFYPLTLESCKSLEEKIHSINKVNKWLIICEMVNVWKSMIMGEKTLRDQEVVYLDHKLFIILDKNRLKATNIHLKSYDFRFFHFFPDSKRFTPLFFASFNPISFFLLLGY